MVPGFAFWFASRLRSLTIARCRIRSVDALRLLEDLKLLDAPVEGNNGEPGYRATNETMGRWDEPALFFVEFVIHVLGELFELALRLGVVRVNNETIPSVTGSGE